MAKVAVRRSTALPGDDLPWAAVEVGETYTLTLEGVVTCDDAPNWDAETLTYSYTPTAGDGGAKKTVIFTVDGLSRSLTIIVFYDWSTAVPYAGNPITPYGTHDWNAWANDPPYVCEDAVIDGTYYALAQVAVTYDAWSNLALFTSTDLLTWTAHATNPVLSGRYILHPSIIKVGSTWRVYYSIRNVTNKQEIHMATSPDLVSWTPYGLVFAYPASQASCPFVRKMGNVYCMWFWDWYVPLGEGGIRYATSSDGISWTHQGFALERIPGEATEGAAELDPWVVYNPTGYWEMVFSDFGKNGTSDQDLWYAVSPDGLGSNWKKHQRIIATSSGVPGSWDQVLLGNGVLLHTAGKVYLYYVGRGAGVLPHDSGGMKIIG